MGLDERHCPQCGHDVLDWGIVCPGCNKIPGETANAKKVLRQEKIRTTLKVTFVVGILSIVIGYFLYSIYDFHTHREQYEEQSVEGMKRRMMEMQATGGDIEKKEDEMTSEDTSGNEK